MKIPRRLSSAPLLRLLLLLLGLVGLMTSRATAQTQETRLFKNHEDCGGLPSSITPLCITRGYECREEDADESDDNDNDNDNANNATLKCLPAQENGEFARLMAEGVFPWEECKPKGEDSVCGFNFKCICDDSKNQEGCMCRPPDAVTDEISTTTCDDDCSYTEYCQFKTNPATEKLEVTCADMPYFAPDPFSSTSDSASESEDDDE